MKSEYESFRDSGTIAPTSPLHMKSWKQVGDAPEEVINDMLYKGTVLNGPTFLCADYDIVDGGNVRAFGVIVENVGEDWVFLDTLTFVDYKMTIRRLGRADYKGIKEATSEAVAKAGA